MSNKKTVFGIDLGTNSIGWAVIKENDKGKPCSIDDVGVRIFIRAVEAKTQTPKNQARRNARLARRLIQRRVRRRQRLMNFLIKEKFLPDQLENSSIPEKILNEIGDPYVLRQKALSHALTPYEFGRVILHLGARRGFLSTRKNMLGDLLEDPDVLDLISETTDEAELLTEAQAKEETNFKKDIETLKEKIRTSGSRTLGEYLANLNPHEDRRRGLRTDRQMYLNEIAAIFSAQRQYVGNIYSDDLKQCLEKIIFYQRPIKLRSNRLGRCSLEPSCKRAHKARLEVQRMCYWQDLNNLNYANNEHMRETHFLTLDQKQKVVDALEKQQTLSWPKLRKMLELSKSITFNLEKQGTKKLTGNVTSCKIRSVVGEQWDDMTDQAQYELVNDLLTIKKKSVLKARLEGHWRFDGLTAVKLVLLDFGADHANLSLKAIKRLLPYMQQGIIYSDARHKAGYNYEQPSSQAQEQLGLPPQIPNPIVSKALYELRKVINALIQKHGNPHTIRIELARDIKMSAQRKAQYNHQLQINNKLNDQARSKYKEIRMQYLHLHLPEEARKADILKYRLWTESNKQCTYTGKHIPLAQLFTQEVEIDHILPRQRTLDDSYMNKTICLANVNAKKADHTPYEAFASDEAFYEQLLQRTKHYPLSKMKRFRQRELDKDFISSQLNDTAYTSKVAHDYLKQLGCDISVNRGSTTAWLRHQWGLNQILGENGKNRTDHRHHAVDAIVIALCNRKLYQHIVHQVTNTGSSGRIFLSEPLHDFVLQVNEKVDNIVVSHDKQTQLNGSLHEETSYGVQKISDSEYGLVYRKKLDKNFKSTSIKDIVNPQVQKLVQDRVAQYGNDIKKAFSDDLPPLFHLDGKTPIRRVRIYSKKGLKEKDLENYLPIKDKTDQVFKVHVFGNNHHVEIIRHVKTGKYQGKVITMWEATNRLRRKQQPLFCKDHGDTWTYVASLCINDMVSIIDGDERKICRVQKFNGNGQIMLRNHIAATLDDKGEQLLKVASTLMTDYQLQKLDIDVLGQQRD